MSIEREGPAPDQRGKNSPFFFWGKLSKDDKDICYRLVNSGGMLGWDKKCLNAAHIKLVQAEDLVKRGVWRKTSLFQLAKELTEDDFCPSDKKDFDEQGGFLALRNEKERDFFRNFDQAIEIMNEGKTTANLKERYQIARRDVYDYIDSML